MRLFEITPIIGTPNKFSKDDITQIVDLILSGNEVGSNQVISNIKNAAIIVTIKDDTELKGIATLKNPLSTYRKHISDKSGFDVSLTKFPYELGYIVIIPSARGTGLSRILVDAAVNAANGKGIFATARTNNTRMISTLQKFGFKPVGNSYLGRDGVNKIQIFVR